MTKEEFESAIIQIAQWLNSRQIDTRAAMNNTIFTVNVPSGNTINSMSIRFINYGHEGYWPNYIDGTTEEGGVLVDTKEIRGTSLEFQAALILNWATIKSDIEDKIADLRKKGEAIDAEIVAKAKAEEERVQKIYESVPSEFKL